MAGLTDLLSRNREWAAAISEQDPEFFHALALQQSPRYLWIGCSDSRVPANQIVGLAPGELFVHRNIANVVVHSDLNCLSVIQFAVEVLKVEEIIVCGHYGCSGVHAAFRGKRIGLADNWLRHIQDVHQKHQTLVELAAQTDFGGDCLCELNVIEQVLNVCQTTLLQDAWLAGKSVTVHGVIYGLQDGRLRDLGMSVSSPDELNGQYQSAMARVRQAHPGTSAGT